MPKNGQSPVTGSGRLPSTCYVVFASLVVDLLAFTVILPLMPAILDHYSQHDQSGFYSFLDAGLRQVQSWIGSPLRHNQVLLAGVIGSWFSFLQYLSMPVTGSLSDSVGRKPVLLVCLFGTAVSYAIWTWAGGSFVWFIVSRTVGGLAKGNVSLSTAIATDATDQQRRNRAMALVGIAFSIGFILGPMIGAAFSVWSKNVAVDGTSFMSTPAIFALVLSLVNLAFMAFAFKESLPPTSRTVSVIHGLSSARQFISPFSLFAFQPVRGVASKDVVFLQRTGLVYFLFLFIYSGLEFTLSFLTHVRFNYSSMQQGQLYLFAGLIMVLIQGGFVRRVRPGSELSVALMGVVAVVPAFLILSLASTNFHLYVGLSLYALASATAVPSLTTVVSTTGPADQKGVILGTFRSLGALARALGPVTFSMVFWHFGPTFCYVSGALLMLLPVGLLMGLGRTVKTSDKTQ